MFTTLLDIQPDTWITLAISALGLVGTGGVIKLYNTFTKSRKDRLTRNSADGLAFRKSLQDRVVDLEDKIDYLTSKIENMIDSNTELVIKLNAKIATLQAENAVLRSEAEARKTN